MSVKVYPKVSEIKRPLEIGELLTVACMVKRDEHGEIISITPVIDTPHNDRENGQPEVHYHADFRFIRVPATKELIEGFMVVDTATVFGNNKSRLVSGEDGQIEYMILTVVDTNHTAITQRIFIRNSNLKRKCIHKGRCPHRGYDLSQEVPVNGIITCPLHGLEFHADTGRITDRVQEDLKNFREREAQHKERVKLFHRKLNAIQEGSTISEDQLNELESINGIGYSSSRYPCDGGFECTIRITHTDDYFPKEIENGKRVKFRVATKKPLSMWQYIKD